MKLKVGSLFLVILILTGGTITSADEVNLITNLESNKGTNFSIIESKDVGREKATYTSVELQNLTKVNYDGKNFNINLPKLGSRQQYEYELYRDNKSIDKGSTTGLVDLPKTTKEESFKLNVRILDSNYETLLEANLNIAVKDEALPELDYAYVENGEVTLNFKDNYKLNGKLYYTDSKNKDKEIKVRNNKFTAETPSDIEIVIVSPLGKEKKISLKINNDNSVIYGKVSAEIEKKLHDNRIMHLNNYKSINNLFVGQKNRLIDLRKESQHLIFEKYGKFNDDDITFTSDDISINGYFGELVKSGLSTVKINHSFYNKEELTFLVYVQDNDRIYNTNIEKIELKGKMVTNNKTFIPKDYIHIKEKIEGYEPILDFILIVDGNKAYKTDKEIDLIENAMNQYKIIDILTDKEYTISLKHENKADNENNPISFSDVKGNHWAYHDIKELAFKGLVRGYTDGSYKPDNNITVKEFMVLLNRVSNKGAKFEVETFKNSLETFIPKNDWAYIDTLSIYRKVKLEDLNRFPIGNINRNITRGEVAFLVDSSLKIETSGKQVNLMDISNSIYREHINNLASSQIINGYEDGTFKPGANITRAETSSILNRLLK